MAKYLSEEEIVRLVKQDIDWARNYRDEHKEDWLRFYKLYENYLDKQAYPWTSNLSPPTAHTIIEVQVAFMLEMLFGEGDVFEVLGKTIQGQVSARAVKQLIDYHLRFSFNIYQDMEKFVRQLLIYGTSIYKVFWDWKPGWKTEHLPKYDKLGEVTGTREVLFPRELKNQPTGYPVDLWHFLVDPNADCIERARFVAEESDIDKMDFLEMQQSDIYRNVELPHSGGFSREVNAGFTERMGEIGRQAYQSPHFVERQKVHIVEYWGYLAKGWSEKGLSKSAKQQLYHVIVAETPSQEGINTMGLTLLLAKPTPFKHNRHPYVDARMNNLPGEFYGKGDMHFLESLLVEERDQRNMHMENQNNTMNRMWKVKNESDLTENDLITRPGGMIRVRDMEEIDVLDTGRTDHLGIFKTAEDIRRGIEYESGVNDFTMGQYSSSTGFNDTATGIHLIQQAALRRLGHKGNIVQTALKNIGQMTFALLAQFLRRDVAVRVLDKDTALGWRFVDVSTEALSREYDFLVVNAPSVGSRNIQIQQLIQLLQIMMQALGQGGPKPDFGRFINRIIEKMGIPNPKELTGFSSFNQPVPTLGKEDAIATEPMLPPDEENRLMIEQGQYITPKLEEHHVHHIYVHSQMYDELSDDHPAKRLVEEHVRIHQKLAEQTRQIIAAQTVAQGAAQAAEAQGNILQMRSQGRGNSSPTGAGGAEDQIRLLGNLGAGNVGAS